MIYITQEICHRISLIKMITSLLNGYESSAGKKQNAITKGLTRLHLDSYVKCSVIHYPSLA